MKWQIIRTALVLAMAVILSAGASAQVTVQVYTAGSPDIVDFFKDTFAQFMEANPEIKIEYETGIPGSGYRDKLGVFFAAGNVPDVFWMTGGRFYEWYQRDAFRPLNDLIDKENYDLSVFFPGAIDQFTVNGKHYALPFDFATRLMFYNVDMFSEAGIPRLDVSWDGPGWSFVDAQRIAQKLTVVDGSGEVKRWGLSVPPNQFGILPFVYGNGGRLVKEEDGRMMSAIDSKEAIEALEYLHGLIVEREIAKLGGWNGFFADGLAGTGVEHGGAIGLVAAKVDFEVDIAPFPAGTVGSRTGQDGQGWFISKTSSVPAEAWEVVKHVASYEVQRKMTQALSFPTVPRPALVLETLDQLPVQSTDVLVQAYDHGVLERMPGPYESFVQQAFRQYLVGQISTPELVELFKTEGQVLLDQ